jgi:hypothetical protein
MIDEKPGPQSPFDQGKLRLVREFLQREFRGCRHDDYFDPAKTAQVFVIEPHRRPRYILIIPKGTFEQSDFAFPATTISRTRYSTRGAFRSR